MEPTAMSLILTDIGLVVTALLGMVGEVAAVFVGEPVLMIPLGIGIGGIAWAKVRGFVR